MLRVFSLLYILYAPWLKFEAGNMLSVLILGLLESPCCTVSVKMELCDCIDVLIHQPNFIVNLFYNYDNSVPAWPLCERY